MIARALMNLTNSTRWMVEDGVLHWQDTEQSQPTASELDAEVIRLQAAYDALEYSRLRQLEYPTIGDQLDALWKGGDAQAAMLTLVNAVKTKYPKG